MKATVQPSLFSKPKPDYMAEVKSRLNKLEIMRKFSDSSGAIVSCRIIYTTPLTCLHTEFRLHIKGEYKCLTPDCPGIITENQLAI